jgi:drug/metabolite transporter (DMT)-like permease
MDATTLLMLRMLIAFPFYLGTFLIYKSRYKGKINPIYLFWTLFMGIVGYYWSSLFDFIGLQYVSAGIERIILFVYPTLALIINKLLFKVTISKRQWISILITYLGIGTAYWGEMKIIPNTSLFIYGSSMVLLCGITYAFYLVGTGKLVPILGAGLYTSLAMLAASIGIFTHYLIQALSKGTLNTLRISIPNHIIGHVIALAMIATVIPSFLLSTGMKRLGSNNLSIITSIGPVATLFQANWLLGETLSWQQILGTLLVIIGVIRIGKEGDKNKLG